MVNWWIDGEESELVQAVKDAGYNLYKSQYACWERCDPHYMENVSLNLKYPTILQGSIQFNDFVRKLQAFPELNFEIYPEINIKNYNCTSYYPEFGNKLLNSNYTMLPFGDVKRRKEWLFKEFGQDQCLFIRPDSGLKEFTGTIIKYESFEKDLDYLSFYEPDNSLLTIVATPQPIDWEARFIVCNYEIVTGSYYRVNRLCQQKLVEDELIDDAQELLNEIKWRPDEIYVLDLCESNKELKVVEIGAFSYAGLYRCDRNKIVESVSNFVIDKHNKYWEEERDRRKF